MTEEKSLDFLAFFVDLTDPRVDRGKNHKLEDVIGLALCGIICGADTWVDVERLGLANEDWFRQYLELPHGIPSHDNLGRIFCRLDVQSFQSCIGKWVEHLQFCLKGQTVAIDRKTVRGSCDKAKKQQALHLVSAWASQVNFCLGQVSVDSKSNEIPAVRELLRKASFPYVREGDIFPKMPCAPVVATFHRIFFETFQFSRLSGV